MFLKPHGNAVKIEYLRDKNWLTIAGTTNEFPTLDIPADLALPPLASKCSFASIYNKAELYEAALRVYTKPLFLPAKGLATPKKDRIYSKFNFSILEINAFANLAASAPSTILWS